MGAIASLIGFVFTLILGAVLFYAARYYMYRRFTK